MKKSTEPDPIRPGDLIRYRSNAFWVVHKPAGIPILSDQSGDKSLLDLVEIYGKRRFYPVHRLDRPVSGLVVLARTRNAASVLSAQFAAGEVRKIYLAVTAACPDPVQGSLTHHLKHLPRHRKAVVVEPDDPDGQEARLRYRVKAHSERYHLLEVEPETGRFHQIRAQLGAIGCPIKGDVKYGARRGNRDRSIHLHAWQLAFPHPVSGEPLSFTEEPPQDALWSALAGEPKDAS